MSSLVYCLYLFFNVADPIVPNLQYQSPEEEYITDHRCNSAFLFWILEILMSHGTSRDKGWSREALEFSAILSPDSLLPSVNVSLLVQPL